MPKNTLQIPEPLRALATLRKLEHFLACEKLAPRHTPETAAKNGYTPLSKPFRPRYLKQCHQMLALMAESQREFDVTVVLEKAGLALWKRRNAFA